jgi:UDP-4-amino-4,6-dideoxy-N-acetyl-beta-L-altrosamine transaminase/dTDP-4-dehydrorhamnose reductase
MPLSPILLITGVSGLLGNGLARYFADQYQAAGWHHRHPVDIPHVLCHTMDMEDESRVRSSLADLKPAVVIHCASLTDVDACEGDPERADRLNVAVTRNLVNALAGESTPLVYISSDSVFDGTKGAYNEEDPVHPLNHYGRTKWEGEREVLRRPTALVLRTNIFGWNIQDKLSLAEWMLSELSAGRPIKGFTDAVFSTIYTMELARIIDLALRAGLKGTYHAAASDACSKFEFGRKLACRFGLDPNLVQPASLDDHHFRAKRGKNLSLNVSRLTQALNYTPPTIDQSLDAFYRDAMCGLPQRVKAGLVQTDTPDEIPYGRHSINLEDVRAVARVLLSDRITQGPVVAQFEEALARYCGARYAVGVSSGTAGLHLACLAAGLGPGYEAITAPITFVASANAVVYCGARPIFADIDPHTYNLSALEVEKSVGSSTRALVPVHFAGQSCDMAALDQVRKAAEKKFGHKIYIIEDASHALGSKYQGTRVGSCAWSDMAVFSFHPVKHITTGEGGAILTNDEGLYRKLLRLRTHGITHDPADFQNPVTEYADEPHSPCSESFPWYYEQLDLGFNYRITDIQCALGISQLKRVDAFRARRREIVEQYQCAFAGLRNVNPPFESEPGASNFHLYVLAIDFQELGITRARLMAELRKEGILTQVHYIPVLLHPFYRKNSQMRMTTFPEADRYYQRCLTIPLFPMMKDQDIRRVIRAVKMMVEGASCRA